MKITDVKENQVIHCNTKEEFARIISLLLKADLKSFHYSSWGYFKESTCIDISIGKYDSTDWFLAHKKVCQILDSAWIEEGPTKTQKPISIKEIGEKQVIHCKTKEELDRICKILNDQGFKLNDGRPFSEIRWYARFEETCINVKGGYVNSDVYYGSRDYEIIDSTLISSSLVTPLASAEITHEGLIQEPLTPTEKAKEAVNHPSHYGSKDDPYEVIKVIDAWELDFSVGNVIKYVARAGKKDPAKEIEDLKKAAKYLQFAINKREAKL